MAFLDSAFLIKVRGEDGWGEPTVEGLYLVGFFENKGVVGEKWPLGSDDDLRTAAGEHWNKEPSIITRLLPRDARYWRL
jgi:hypothetical protein